MRIYNNLILYLALAFSAVDSVLAFMGQKDLQVYFTLNLAVYLVITLLVTYLNPRTRRALNAVTTVFFIGFGVVVALKIINVLKI